MLNDYYVEVPAGPASVGFSRAVGLALIGTVAWTITSNHVRHPPPALTGASVYNHALTAGVHAALTIGAAATVLALLVTLATIRVRREDLPD